MKISHVLILVAVSTFGLVACGGSDDGAASDATATESRADLGSDSSPAPSDVTATVADGSGAGSASDGSGGDAEEFCVALADAQAQVTSAAGPQDVADAFRGIADVAPDEISDATDRLIDFIEQGAAISSLPEAEQSDAIAAVSAQEADYTAAAGEVETYARENCANLDDSFFGSGS